MVSLNELTERVDAIFAGRPAEIADWTDPNPEREPADDAYSRVTNPERWRIVNVRADAWTQALSDLGLARIDRPATITWAPGRYSVGETHHNQLLVPAVPQGLCLALGHLHMDGVSAAGVVVGASVGAGAPAELVEMIPDCSCDACDSGSADALEVLDRNIINIVGGTYRRLAKGRQTVTVFQDGRGSSNMSRRQVERLLAKPPHHGPKGWSEQVGLPWVSGTRRS